MTTTSHPLQPHTSKIPFSVCQHRLGTEKDM